jgi:hypothetical protein
VARNIVGAVKELRTPPWLRRHFGDRWVGLFALLTDGVLEALTEALFASWLREPTAPPDALAWTGIERSIERFPGETNESYRDRLIAAWTAWEQAGNEAALLAQLDGLGLTDIEIVSYRTPGWDWDSAAGLTWAEGVGAADNWSRFWVIIKGHPWVGEGTFGDGAIYGDGGSIGSNATLEQIGAMKRAIKKWKPAHVQCAWIILVTDEATWDVEQPDGTWHDWRNRSTSALYIDVQQRPVLLA